MTACCIDTYLLFPSPHFFRKLRNFDRVLGPRCARLSSQQNGYKLPSLYQAIRMQLALQNRDTLQLLHVANIRIVLYF